MREDSGTFGVVLGCLGSSDLADMDKIAPFKVVHATLTRLPDVQICGKFVIFLAQQVALVVKIR